MSDFFKISYFDFLLYSNFFLLTIAVFLQYLFPYDAYVISSILLNLIAILVHGKIRKYNFLVILFFIYLIFNSVFYYMEHGMEHGIGLVLRNLWLFTSIIAIHNIIYGEKKIFEKIQNFFMLFSILVLFDLTLSLFLHAGNIYTANEGFKFVFIPSPLDKYFMLFAIPLLLYRRDTIGFLLASLFIVIMLLGTRSAIISVILISHLSIFFLSILKKIFHEE